MTIPAFMLRGPDILSRWRLIALLFLLFSFFSVAGAAKTAALPEGAEKISLQRGMQEIAVFTVETVSYQRGLQKGLAGRPRIPDDFGMLFVLDSTRDQFFWMNGVEFPLDILFFDKDKKLIEVLADLLPCEECPKYRAPAHTAYALEINAGMADALGIKRGDSLVFTNK